MSSTDTISSTLNQSAVPLTSSSLLKNVTRYEDVQNQSTSKNGAEMGKSDFLTLFTAQLKNQDPLDPVKNEAFVAQLAQFSQLEALTNMQTSMDNLVNTMSAEKMLGSAALMSVQPALVRAIYPRAQLGRGLGFNTTVVATSLAAGPSVGAALLSIAPWPYLFFVYVPLGLVSFVLAERFLPHTTHTHRPFDWTSAALSGATFGLLIFGIDGLAHGHHRLQILAELAAQAIIAHARMRESTLEPVASGRGREPR